LGAEDCSYTLAYFKINTGANWNKKNIVDWDYQMIFLPTDCSSTLNKEVKLIELMKKEYL
jgi:hypothetical protein